jgi:hypothetical protein
MQQAEQALYNGKTSKKAHLSRQAMNTDSIGSCPYIAKKQQQRVKLRKRFVLPILLLTAGTCEFERHYQIYVDKPIFNCCFEVAW